ncbi:hypothetical protein ABIE51_000655 [Lysobacter sp. OAE881]|uniref:hypothetical protein n=1 Tax=Lysobacter TaxID=68 RepID=UPI00178A6C50|nr:hypothetical protein [Lysobacter soli]MDG2517203.1 hypothetical protein [Lysobacter soli]
MPDMWDLVEKNWPLMAEHPWLFIKWAAFWVVVGALIGWKAGRAGSPLTSVAAPGALPAQAQGSEEFQYPERGRHGPNALSNRTTHVRVGEELSFAARVPGGDTVRIVIEGPPHPTQPSMFQNPGWGFSVMNAQNWKVGKFEAVEGGWRQPVDAHEGPADLSFRFQWHGDFSLTAYEGDSHKRQWTHKIRVDP